MVRFVEATHTSLAPLVVLAYLCVTVETGRKDRGLSHFFRHLWMHAPLHGGRRFDNRVFHVEATRGNDQTLP